MGVLGRGLLGSAAAPSLAGSAQALPVQVQRGVTIRQNVRIGFRARRLPEGGYYYAVIVLKPYEHYTSRSPPPCSTSSNMQRTDYGYPRANGEVRLELTRAKSATGRWCAAGSYVGAIYAVPHAPPCESTYPCRSEPYEPPSPCWEIEGHPVCGVVALPREYSYPDPPPAPLATGTNVVARFTVKFPR